MWLLTLFLCAVGDLRTNIHSLSKSKIGILVHILVLHVGIAPDSNRLASNVIVSETNIWWTHNTDEILEDGRVNIRPAFLNTYLFVRDTRLECTNWSCCSPDKSACVWKMISYVQTWVIWRKQKKHLPWVCFTGFESSVSHCSLSLCIFTVVIDETELAGHWKFEKQMSKKMI